MRLALAVICVEAVLAHVVLVLKVPRRGLRSGGKGLGADAGKAGTVAGAIAVAATNADEDSKC